MGILSQLLLLALHLMSPAGSVAQGSYLLQAFILGALAVNCEPVVVRL